MVDTQSKGNIAEVEIELQFKRLFPDCASVIRIPNQEDVNHWDLFVTSTSPIACFQVQAKALTRDNRRLATSHLEDWIRAPQPTVLMWWDDRRRKAYWADILRFLLRTGGTVARGTATFSEHKDLRLLDIEDSKSRAGFVAWLRDRCKLWPLLGLTSMGEWPSDIEFPVSFVDAIADPDILLYLPVSRRLVDVLEDYMGGSPVGRARVSVDVLRMAREAPKSPRAASMRLVQQYGLPKQDRDLLMRLENCLANWCERIPPDRKLATARTLWAFDKLLSVVSYCQTGDLSLPAFAARHTYPMGRLINLLPASLFVDPILRILQGDNDWRVLLHAAWAFGILNHPVGSEPWRPVRERRITLRTRTNHIGRMWPLVDRQLLYAEAQLGSAQAQVEFIRKLSRQEVAQFEAAYNFSYYDGDPDVIRDRFERRFEEGFRTDANVRQIIALDYLYLRKHMRSDNTGQLRLVPDLWQVE